MAGSEIDLQAIQSMLTAGHRSLRLERHTVMLWGGVGGLMCIATDWVVNAENFPDIKQHALALFCWLIGWLAATAWADYRLTGLERERRDESLPFAQAQLRRVWWMLLGVGVLGSCAMFFHGGGGMVYALWTVLLGLGIYLFGLFSQPLLEWIGLATITLGAGGLAVGLGIESTRWIAAACFALGMPLAGWMAERGYGSRWASRGLALLAWLTVVIAPAILLRHTAFAAADPAQDEQVVRLPAGTRVTLDVDLDSTQLRVSPETPWTLTLNQDLAVALRDGQPDGRYRFGQNAWARARDGSLTLRIDRLAPALERNQAVIHLHAIFTAQEHSR